MHQKVDLHQLRFPLKHSKQNTTTTTATTRVPFLPECLYVFPSAQAVKGSNINAASMRNEFQIKMDVAERFVNEPCIYYPHQVDFRCGQVDAYLCSSNCHAFFEQ